MIKCLAIDDEPLALQQLSQYIEKIPFLELLGSCQSAKEASNIMKNDIVDAIFVDINMPDVNGMDFVKSLSSPPIVVFTTAYSEYALEGYKVDAVDYLLKPFGLTEFKCAADKVKEMYLLKNAHSAPAVEEKQAEDLFLKTEHKVIRINISKIRYIESMSEYLKIYVEDQPKPYIMLMSMKKLEETLPNYFMRIHRSYIVNLKEIAEVNKNRVIMDEDTYLPIGDLYKDSLNEYIKTRLIGK